MAQLDPTAVSLEKKSRGSLADAHAEARKFGVPELPARQRAKRHI